MAAVLTFTEERNGTIKKVICDWLSHTDGVASSSTTYAYDGELLAVMFVPDTAGTAPDDLYDVTITDGTNDLLAGKGADLSGTNTILITSGMIPITNDKLTINVTGAGDSNGGLIYIYIR